VTASPTIAIVGGGFAGIGLAIALRKAGIESFTLYERAADVGGVWRDNRYPGAACDVPSRFYSFSFEPDYPWSEAYGRQPEIWDYIKRCVARHGLAPKIRFGVNVLNADFDADARKWRLHTASGERIEADVFVSAVGVFNNPVEPEIDGRDSFAGPQFHSARWRHDVELAGKRVAVIGTGASAVQFVPAIASQVAQMHVFQRTPQYVMPRLVRDGQFGMASWLKRHWQRFRIFWTFETGNRRRFSDKLTAQAEAVWRANMERKVRDPALRAKLTPSYRLGCKRVLQSNLWYDALTRDNVEVVDTTIAALTADGVRTTDGRERKADVVIYGTGFSPTEFLTPMRIAGLHGRTLAEAWRDGAEAYYGMTVAGFPNFFMLYGPNTNTATSILFMLEAQFRYIVRAIRLIAAKPGRAMNLRAEVMRRFNTEIQAQLARTVLTDANCHSYFRTASGKVTTNWPGYPAAYRWRTRRVRRADYELA
jgi:cation diffusion facilitator CzcD-associated flavoprotein CzcO